MNGGMEGEGAGMSLEMSELDMNEMGGDFFSFFGDSLSLQSRMDSLSDANTRKLIGANIHVTGTKIKTMNMWSYICTFIWATIIFIPFFFIFCDWWKRCTD